MRILEGDALTQLRTLPDESVNCCVTSPPYWGLRDYGVNGQLGLEATPEEYVAHIVEVFREVRRALRKDGTCWINLGDSYAASRSYQVADNKHPAVGATRNLANARLPAGLKQKDLIGIPWRVAFALQADGWYLRSDIIWHKPNPMPESVTDRPTKAHEYLFLLSKSAKYYYDAEAIKEPCQGKNKHDLGFHGGHQQAAYVGAARRNNRNGTRPGSGNVTRKLADGTDSRLNTHLGRGIPYLYAEHEGRNCRTVWTVSTNPFKGAHFATFPPKLIEPCILAGCPKGGIVLDPFAGAFTTPLVAQQHGRDFIAIELNPAYIEMGRKRLQLRTKAA